MGGECSRVPSVLKIAFPCPRSAACDIAAICRTGEIKRSVRRYIVHRLRNNTVLESRFVPVRNIINDDVAFVHKAKGTDIVGEAVLAGKGSSKEKFGPWCKVVNDLHHCRPLVLTVRGSLLAWQYRYIRGEISGCD